MDHAQAVAFYRLPARLALMWHSTAWATCTALALVLLKTTLQRCGFSSLLPPKDILKHRSWLARCHERGLGVAVDVAEAIRWYRRAQAAGDTEAAGKLQQLSA